MSAPLFGYTPKNVTPKDVYEDCVVDFSTSLNRQFIWDGIKRIVQQTASIQGVGGSLHVDSEFVETTHEPSQAALLLEANAPLSRELFDLWRTDNGKEWLVQTFILPPRPDNPERAEAWEETRKELIADLTEHGTKGYPIVDFITCHTFTKS